MNNRIRPAVRATVSVLLAMYMPMAQAQTAQITAANWGAVTSPVYGTSESGVYSAAELFAGPNKFGSYFNGVLPNGRMVKPVGFSAQVGTNPLGIALTPDGKYLISTNDDEREGGLTSYFNSSLVGGYTITVVDTATMNTVSQITAAGSFFIGLQVTGAGPYTVWASGGPNNDVKLFNVSAAGVLSKGTPVNIAIKPITPVNAGFVSNYVPDAVLNTADSAGNKPSIPSSMNAATGDQTTFPAGSALSPDGKFLYVACNGDNSVAVIDTAAKKVVRQVPVGFFPYGVSVSAKGDQVMVANWGVTEYKFYNPIYDAATNKLLSIGTTGQNSPDGFYVPNTDVTGRNPKTSSVTMLTAPGGDGSALTLRGAIYQGKTLDALYQVGDTHPSASAIVKQGDLEVLYVTKSNSDSLGVIRLDTNTAMPDVDMSPVALTLADKHAIHGAYPNAIVVSPNNSRMYVAEAGINSVAVFDTTNALAPRLLGRIGTGWYPTALTISADGNMLYIANAKGMAADINANIDTAASHNPSGVQSDTSTDSNYIFGTVQKVDLSSITLENSSVLANNFSINMPADTSIVPVGGAASAKIKHVFMILHENKTFDSMLGNQGAHFGPFASNTFNDRAGKAYTNAQYTGVSLNWQALANKFATAVNYYSDSEESDAGHQFAASGTASDYTEKTLLVKSGRGLLVNKNFEPEDYPEGGYIFNNAVRNGVSFKDYGALVRIEGTDTGTSKPAQLNDVPSGLAGYPKLQTDNVNLSNPLVLLGDTTSPVQGLGQSYFISLPVLQVLGTKNPNGEPRLDMNYPGYNFNISDQRRAQEFIQDFDRMVASNTLPTFIYVYQPNDHTGGVQAPNAAAVGGPTAVQQVADGDIGMGMVISHIMNSPIYYDSKTGEGSAIFMSFDDAQATIDHIHPHRTPMVMISPYAKPGYIATRHYSTASIVKTEELLMGLPPNNFGDLAATDLRDMFQSTYNGIKGSDFTPTLTATYVPTKEGKKIWSMVAKLDTQSGPDKDSARLGELARLSMAADSLRFEAEKRHKTWTPAYKREQAKLLKKATDLVNGPKRDGDD